MLSEKQVRSKYLKHKNKRIRELRDRRKKNKHLVGFSTWGRKSYVPM